MFLGWFDKRQRGSWHQELQPQTVQAAWGRLGVYDAGSGHSQLDPTRWGLGALSRKVGLLALQMKRLHSPCRQPLCNDEHPHFCLEQAFHLYRLIPT